jgi:hypothetical protein
MENLTLDGNGESVILDGGNTVRVLWLGGMRLTLNGVTLPTGKLTKVVVACSLAKVAR